MDQVEEELNVERPAAERRGGPRTVAGVVMAELGRLPTVGERVQRWGFTFEVVDMDCRRIDRILVLPAGQAGQAAAGTGSS
jgi:CBS domain containing-hemolysin-like protein